MNKIFHILIDQLREKELEIDATVSPEFFEINEKELKMNFDVQIKGKAYLSEDFLIISLSAKTFYQKTCSICNDFVTCELSENFYHAQPLAEIKKDRFDFSEELRNNLLIKIPHFVECNEGNCLERKNLENYLKKPIKDSSDYFPFETLEKNNF